MAEAQPTKRRFGRIMVRLTKVEFDAVRAASKPAPLAAWARRSLIARAKRSIRQRIDELQRLGGTAADAKIVRLAARLEALTPPRPNIEEHLSNGSDGDDIRRALTEDAE